MLRVAPGTTVDVQVTYRDDLGELTDPTTLVFKTHEPDGTHNEYEYGVHSQVSLVSAGIYKGRLLVDRAGRFQARFEATLGTAQKADEFVVIGNETDF
jgi:hypothetical protein